MLSDDSWKLWKRRLSVGLNALSSIVCFLTYYCAEFIPKDRELSQCPGITKFVTCGILDLSHITCKGGFHE